MGANYFKHGTPVAALARTFAAPSRKKTHKKGEPDSPYSVPETVPDQPPEFTTNRPANHPRRARKKAAFGVCLQA
ncbi:Uncharacterised protein [Bordetella pertussis]|nr:Uncharacterised protein [Bordetella pertussis]